MSVLVDTSVWVDHFRVRNDALVQLLEADRVLGHPMIQIELACGTPPAPRLQTLNNIGLLQPCNQAGLREVADFIERERLYGLGSGLVAMVLLASTLITPGAQLWTLDKRLRAMAERFRIAFQAPGY
ncbi:MAG: type II toxin-antitoxin system VapC family toxin [Advenella sp.]|uniref:type II toxin-antitoxin system VapC family toxin n=1 Tax=unclassified Advenella TaxID=2685285 RepID=UPI0018693E03|nr:VapC toxin family PIN domain ribonuclease [Advenella sp. FME57]